MRTGASKNINCLQFGLSESSLDIHQKSESEEDAEGVDELVGGDGLAHVDLAGLNRDHLVVL